MTTTSDMASQGGDVIDAQEKASVDPQQEECCGLEFQRVLLLNLLLPKGRFGSKSRIKFPNMTEQAAGVWEGLQRYDFQNFFRG
jgi:hypothetical protein